jgi:hypothetical protein
MIDNKLPYLYAKIKYLEERMRLKCHSANIHIKSCQTKCQAAKLELASYQEKHDWRLMLAQARVDETMGRFTPFVDAGLFN